MTGANDPEFRREVARKQEMEIEARAVMHAALVRLAKINKDQAIQIATSQQPGKVLLCSLGAKGWEEPRKLGNDGKVFYHVIIADENNAGASTHVWVNGTVMKTEKELPRKKTQCRRPVILIFAPEGHDVYSSLDHKVGRSKGAPYHPAKHHAPLERKEVWQHWL